MARKVFISFLGSNNYLETYYSFEGKKSEHPVRFIQEDLVKRLCNEWTKDDRILIFCTDDSKTKNWHYAPKQQRQLYRRDCPCKC